MCLSAASNKLGPRSVFDFWSRALMSLAIEHTMWSPKTRCPAVKAVRVAVPWAHRGLWASAHSSAMGQVDFGSCPMKRVGGSVCGLVLFAFCWRLAGSRLLSGPCVVGPCGSLLLGEQLRKPRGTGAQYPVPVKFLSGDWGDVPPTGVPAVTVIFILCCISMQVD